VPAPEFLPTSFLRNVMKFNECGDIFEAISGAVGEVTPQRGLKFLDGRRTRSYYVGDEIHRALPRV
jgi:hypothetical protein